MKVKYVLILCAIFFILGSISTLQVQGKISALYPSSPESLGAVSQKFEYQGTVTRIIDGDTLEVDGRRIRLVGVDTPERGEAGFYEAANFIEFLCPVGSEAGLDVDDARPKDKYGRTLAVVYCRKINVNAELLGQGYAEIMYIPPSEFDPYSWG